MRRRRSSPTPLPPSVPDIFWGAFPAAVQTGQLHCRLSHILHGYLCTAGDSIDRQRAVHKRHRCSPPDKSGDPCSGFFIITDGHEPVDLLIHHSGLVVKLLKCMGELIHPVIGPDHPDPGFCLLQPCCFPGDSLPQSAVVKPLVFFGFRQASEAMRIHRSDSGSAVLPPGCAAEDLLPRRFLRAAHGGRMQQMCRYSWLCL